jgi:hypothetical protein
MEFRNTRDHLLQVGASAYSCHEIRIRRRKRDSRRRGRTRKDPSITTSPAKKPLQKRRSNSTFAKKTNEPREHFATAKPHPSSVCGST